LADELTPSEQFLALCHNRVQATVSSVAHPDPAIAQAIELCDAKIVQIGGPAIDKLVGDNPFLARAVVPGGAYKGLPDDISTFGVMVAAVSSTDIDEQPIHDLVEAVIENLDGLKRLHPSLRAIGVEGMMKDGLSAPLHPGALRYYRKKGMM
jgi:hypothetical protein